jgi:hypothetical protein
MYATLRETANASHGRAEVGGFCQQSLILLVADQLRNSVANFLEPGKVPQIWKGSALLRLDRLDRAIVSIQKNALPIGFFGKCQPLPVGAKSHVLLYKFMLAEAFERGQAG